MASYLIEHAHEPLQLQSVADAVGLHLHYAMTLFKRVMTLFIGDNLTRYRQRFTLCGTDAR